MENVKEIIQQQGNDPRTYLLQKEILSLQEACVYLSISPSYMYKLTSSRKIPHYSPMGKLIYFKRIELDEWVLKKRRSSEEEINLEASSFIKKVTRSR
jgi:excisionase family DNA binding protein